MEQGSEQTSGGRGLMPNRLTTLAVGLQQRWDDTAWIELWDGLTVKRRRFKTFYHIRGYDDDDMDSRMAEWTVQVCIPRYRPGIQQFESWVHQIWYRRWNSEVKAAYMQCRVAMTTSFSLNDTTDGENNEYEQYIESRDDIDRYWRVQELRHFLARLYRRLTRRERSVLYWMRRDTPYKVIASRLGLKYKTIDNIVTAIRRKARIRA